MNVALIIAGGSGQRMKQEVPKQFLNVKDKPIVVYTMEAFQRHEKIDGIIVVSIEGWEVVISTYARQFGISKLDGIAKGGATGQESIYNGLLEAKKKYHNDDIVLIHDAIRPMVSEEIITECIETAILHGSAITAVPCAEAMLLTESGIHSTGMIDRKTLKRTQTPQAFSIGRILDAHRKAKEKGITNSVASCTLMIELGEEVYFCEGSEKNVKLTTQDDLEIFRALLNIRDMDWKKEK